MDLDSITNIISAEPPSTFLGISIDTVVSVLVSAAVALIVLWLGNRFRLYNAQNKEITELRDTESYFFLMLDVLMDATKKYADAFSDLSRQLRDHNVTTYRVTLVAGMNINEIKDIPAELLYKIFIPSKIGDASQRITTFVKMQKQLNAINTVMGRNEGVYEGFEERDNLHIRGYNRYAVLLRQAHDRMVQNLHNDPDLRDDFREEFMAIHETWRVMENRSNLYIAKEHLVDKLHHLCTTNPGHPLSQKLLDEVMGCGTEFDHLERNKSAYANQFDEFRTVLSKAAIELESVKTNLKGLPFKQPKLWKLI